MEKYLNQIFKFYNQNALFAATWGILSLISAVYIFLFSADSRLLGFKFGLVIYGGLFLCHGVLHMTRFRTLSKKTRRQFSAEKAVFFNSELTRIDRSISILNPLLNATTIVLAAGFVLVCLSSMNALEVFWAGFGAGFFFQSAIATVTIAMMRFQENIYLNRLQYYSKNPDK